MSTSVAVIGAGRMGGGIVQTLVQKGYDVTVYDPSTEAVERARNIGAAAAYCLDDVMGVASTVLLSLPGPNQVRETVEQIVDKCDGRVRFLVDCSTIDPKSASDMAVHCETAGIVYVEAPVSGGPKGAETGTLSIMVGTTEQAFAEIEPLLHDIGKNIYYLGPTGTASLAKICNNIVVATTAAVLGEAFILASAGGISPEKLKSVLEQSVGGSKTLDVFGQHMVSDDFTNATFSLGLMHKDVGLFMDTLRQHNVTSLVGSLVYQIYNGACAQCWGNQDHSVVYRYLKKLNHINDEKANVEATTN